MASIKKLPLCVGMMIDPIYERPEYIQNLVDQVKPNTVFVAAEDKGTEKYLSGMVLSRTDVFLKILESDPWEVVRYGPAKADRIRDYLMLSYVKYNSGVMFFFPRKYKRSPNASKYTTRMRDCIIFAHTLGIRYEIIDIEEQEKMP